MAASWKPQGTITGQPTVSEPLTGKGTTAEPLGVQTASASKLGVVKVGKNLTIDAGGVLAAAEQAQVKVVNAADTLPTGLPAGSVIIQAGNGRLVFYTEDGS